MMSTKASAYPALVDRVRAGQLPPPAERRATRRAARVSLVDLAGELGVSARSLLRWELGYTDPRLEHAIAYRRVLDELRAAISA